MAEDTEDRGGVKPAAKTEAKAPVVEPTSAPVVETAPEEPPAVDAETARREALVRECISVHLANGPVARDTECWNAVQAVIPALAQLKL